MYAPAGVRECCTKDSANTSRMSFGAPARLGVRAGAMAYSTNFAYLEFYELRLNGVLGSSSAPTLCSVALTVLAHIHSLRTQVCCIHRVAQLTPREGAGSLPALLLDQGQLPLQLPPCLCLGGSKETRPCTSVGSTTTSVGSRPSLTPSRKGILEVNPQKIARVTGVLFVITF